MVECWLDVWWCAGLDVWWVCWLDVWWCDGLMYGIVLELSLLFLFFPKGGSPFFHPLADFGQLRLESLTQLPTVTDQMHVKFGQLRPLWSTLV